MAGSTSIAPSQTQFPWEVPSHPVKPIFCLAPLFPIFLFMVIFFTHHSIGTAFLQRCILLKNIMRRCAPSLPRSSTAPYYLV
ncbi:hypothetical protein BDR03DRAFT_959751 [Suillus americanus]|nr:hypothetical protein BDR03DRAFT_959751 [Suillus americanus]